MKRKTYTETRGSIRTIVHSTIEDDKHALARIRAKEREKYIRNMKAEAFRNSQNARKS